MSKPKSAAAAAAPVTLRTVEHRTIPRELLDLRIGNGPEHDGTFEGYANLWNVTDSYGTRFLPGAFRSGGLDESTYALLWMHDPTHVVGTFVAREDERGLRIEGRFAATERGQEARALAVMGAAPELSVGFSRTETLADDETGIVSAELVEVSLITARMASTPGASLSGVRQQLDVELTVTVDDGLCPTCGAELPVEPTDDELAAASTERSRAAALARLRLAGA